MIRQCIQKVMEQHRETQRVIPDTERGFFMPKVNIYDIFQAKLMERLQQSIDSGEPFQWVKPWKYCELFLQLFYPEKAVCIS